MYLCWFGREREREGAKDREGEREREREIGKEGEREGERVSLEVNRNNDQMQIFYQKRDGDRN